MVRSQLLSCIYVYIVENRLEWEGKIWKNGVVIGGDGRSNKDWICRGWLTILYDNELVPSIENEGILKRTGEYRFDYPGDNFASTYISLII